MLLYESGLDVLAVDPWTVNSSNAWPATRWAHTVYVNGLEPSVVTARFYRRSTRSIVYDVEGR